MANHDTKAELSTANYCHGVSPDTSPHEQFSEQAHHAEIQQRTIIVRIASPDVQQRVFEQLRFGSHRSSKGRYLANDIPGLTLQAGDRLEPCKELRNIGQFETQTCPFTCRFWRGESTDRITHDSPLMSIEGVSLELYGVDMLHTWALGCVQIYVGFVIWHFLRCKVLGSGIAWLSAEECVCKH
jgi:hypothetical protein